MGALIDYWYYTGDTRWNEITQQGLLWQTGPNQDYLPPNQTMTEGNDDQVSTQSPKISIGLCVDTIEGFWAMAVLSAAEYNFPNPSPDQPQWLALAQAVFNTQAARWDTSNCNGGLRWQIFTWNAGFDYKNSISQGCFFNIAARLALYTGNETYAEWAYTVWDWMIESSFMHQDSYFIFDGAHVDDDCANITPYQWTYNPGAFLLGAAAMYNYTTDRDPDKHLLWQQRVNGLVSGLGVFFVGDEKVMSEVACESVHLCDNDQLSFKAYLARWMAAATKWAPWIYDTVKPMLDSSAVAAARQCTGGTNGRMCGLIWANDDGQWDGTTGVGQQMAAMEVVLATMIKNLTSPVTNSTGGTSVGNPSAGAKDIDGGVASSSDLKPIAAVDTAWGWILTVMSLVALFGFVLFACSSEDDKKPWWQPWKPLNDEIDPTRRFKLRLGRCGLQKAVNRAYVQDKPRIILISNGVETATERSVLPRDVSMASVSVYSNEQEARAPPAIFQGDEHADDKSWRPTAQQGGFDGSNYPSRGNGAGWRIVDVPKVRDDKIALSSSARVGTSSTDRPRNLSRPAKDTRRPNESTTRRLQEKGILYWV